MSKSRKTEPVEPKPSIYDEIVRFTHEYFGTEAPQHIAKLIEIHTQKPPELVSKDELTSLLDWIRSSVAFLSDDRDLIEKYISELIDITAGVSPDMEE